MITEAEFQGFLDAISDCFVEPDFEAWFSRMRLPFSMVTRAGPVILTCEDDVRDNFLMYLQACEVMNVDHIFRRPLNMERCHDGSWIGTYETNLMCGALRATDPYVSSMLLHITPEGLKMSSILNARGHSEWTGKLPPHHIPTVPNT